MLLQCWVTFHYCLFKNWYVPSEVSVPCGGGLIPKGLAVGVSMRDPLGKARLLLSRCISLVKRLFTGIFCGTTCTNGGTTGSSLRPSVLMHCSSSAEIRTDWLFTTPAIVANRASSSLYLEASRIISEVTLRTRFSSWASSRELSLFLMISCNSCI